MYKRRNFFWQVEGRVPCQNSAASPHNSNIIDENHASNKEKGGQENNWKHA
jgi:hypothetical protein